MCKIYTSQYQLISNSIAKVENFPKPGIVFRDITSLIENPIAFKECVRSIVNFAKDRGFTKVIGTESRGFIFGAPVAIELELPFVLVRKPGKLPREVVVKTYQLEYGTDTLELHRDSIVPGDKVLVIDDLLATGGTISATVSLIQQLGGQCEHAAFIINLTDLPGQKRLNDLGVQVHSIIEYTEN